MWYRRQIFLLILLCLLASGQAAEQEDDGGSLVIGPRTQETRPDWAKLKIQLNSADFDQASAAARALVETHDPAVAPIFWDLYNRGNGQRRLLALRCAGKLCPKTDAETLYRVALSDFSMTIRLAAAEELARLEDAAPACARFGAAAEDEKKLLVYRVRALQALARIGGRGAAEMLLRWLNSKETELAVAAAEGLGYCGGLAQTGPLLKALAAAEPELQPEAAEALSQLTGKKFGCDLVKWAEWEKEVKAAPEDPKPPAGGAQDRPGEYYAPEVKAPGERSVDLALVYDTTGSMGSVWYEVGPELDALLAEVVKQNQSLRLGTVKYRSANLQESQYMVAARPFTRQQQEVRKELLATPFGEGSGAVYEGLRQAVNGLAWRVHARKIVILLGDITPAGAGQALCPRLIEELWRMDGLLVTTLYVHTLHGDNYDVYRGLALAGGGRFFEFNRAVKHLLDNTAEKANTHHVELTPETAAKLITPRDSP